MSREILQNIIGDFNPEKFILFFREKNRSFKPQNQETLASSNENFTDGNLLGEIDFENKDKLIICSFKTSRSLSERSGKKLQYDEGKKILKQENSDAGIFIFYDIDGNFRFSLIYTNYTGKRRDFSTFKRFTYFVSKEFTNKTFLKRIGEGDFSGLENIKNAFSVEKVTKEFYKDIAFWYFWAVKESRFPKDAEGEDNGRNMSVIRMITRMIFIWFMKERGLIKPDLFNYEKISKHLKEISPKDTTYYKAILQNLFFATLNTKIRDRKFRFEKSYHGANKNYMDHSVYRYEDYFNDKNDMLGLFKNIPFLNGGLFDCLDRVEVENGKNVEVRIDGFSDKETGLNVPNKLFFADETQVDLNTDFGTKNKKYIAKGLINILSSYNFVIDENDPNDAEVALDPELLGKVFENLLASFNPETSSTARKATGSYYTPREIVDYMVTQSLKEYFKTNLEDSNEVEKKLDILFSAEGNTNPFDKAQTKKIVGLIEKLRIVDPAVGSGAFPMGILNKLVFILSKLDPGNIYWKEQQIKAVEKNISDPVIRQSLKSNIEEQFTSDKNPDYGRKLYLIEKCIYGVDIQQIAVEIAKLRFFISLLVDENIDKSKTNWGIKPLPNLDYKIMQGNSLLEEYKGIKLIDEKILDIRSDEKENLRENLKKRQSELQSEYIELHSKKKLTKVKKAQLNEELKKVKEQIKKIFKAGDEKNNGDLFEFEKESKKLFKKINMLREEFFIESDRTKKDKLKKEIEDIEWKFIEASLREQNKESEIEELQKVISSNRKPYFLWHFNFGEVFREKGGFDIVIGNPPYFSLSTDSIYIDDKTGKRIKHNRIYEHQGYKVFANSGDIYSLFYEKGWQVIKEKGHLCFITSNKWMRAGYGESSRKFFAENTNPVLLIDFAGQKIFDSATVDTNILLLSKQKNQQKTLACIVKENVLNELSVFVRQQGTECKFSAKESWTILSPIEQSIKRKIEAVGTPLKNWNINIYRGILTGYNEAFIIDRTIKDKLIKEDTKSAEIIRPILRGRDIMRYGYEYADLYLIATFPSLKIDIEQYPAVKQHLLSFGYDRLKQTGEPGARKKTGNKWFETQDSISYWDDFLRPKIIYPNMTKYLPFVYDDKGLLTNQKCFIITGINVEFLTAFFNSSLFKYCFRDNFPELQGGTRELSKIFFDKIPVIQIENNTNLEFKKIVLKLQDLFAKGNPTKELEIKIDEMIFDLYNLTKEEKKTIGFIEIS